MDEHIKIPTPPQWMPKWFTDWVIAESAKDGITVEVEDGKFS